MRGLAERDVTADLATWTISFNAQGSELGEVQAESDRDAATVIAFFRAAGFPAEAVTDAGGSVNQFFDTNRNANSVTVTRRIQLRTTDVMRARRAYARQFELIRGGVAIQEGSSMQYSFTRLNSIKPAMIASATQDARRGAEHSPAIRARPSAAYARRRRAISRSAPVTAPPPRKAAAAMIRRCRRCGVTTIEFY